MSSQITQKTITLDKLGVKESAIVSSVDCDDEALRSHILDMGLTPGVKVHLIKTAPMGDPLEIRLRGYELTLRKADAAKITITDINTEAAQTRKYVEFTTVAHSKIGESESYEYKKRTKKPKEKITLALAGNQNCGKTTLFNQLTGSNQRVGNFPGVTVDKTDGTLKKYKDITITDLPGIYSLSPYSNEEIVTRNFILKEKPDGIINIIDATNIERNLFLTMQLIELNVPMVIALNMMDEFTKAGGSIDINGLENELGIPIIPISALKNEGIGELTEHAINVARFEEYPHRLDFCTPNDGKEGAIHRCLHSILHIVEDHAKAADIPLRFAASKLVEKDAPIIQVLNLDNNDMESCNQLIKQMEEDVCLDNRAAVCDMRFNFIEGLCSKYVSKPDETPEYKMSRSIDKILTGKYTALASFFLILGFIFYITFGHVGIFLSGCMETIVDTVTGWIDTGLSLWGVNETVHSLIIDGICAGVGSVLGFLPVIVILFFFLSILEDTGYMARVAFFMDKLLRKIGLSGRSFVPMLIGFGCSVPAIMATRTLPSERDRKLTIFLTPFMSCSAKLPIYALFVGAFFAKNQLEVVCGLYLIGILVGIIFAYVVKIFVSKEEPVPFVLELPNYRMPSLQNVYRLIYYKAKGFITKAFTIIFFATIVVWFLEHFDYRLNIVEDPSNSLLAWVGAFILPIFKPLGINDWRIATAFVTGFMAKESVVSTLTVLLGDVSKLPEVFTKLSAFVFLIFSLLYTPCVAAIATVRRELSKRYAFFVVVLQCSIAWVVAFIVYSVGKMFI